MAGLARQTNQTTTGMILRSLPPHSREKIMDFAPYSLQPKAIVTCSLGFTADILYPRGSTR